jgi:hypothetical protein
LSHGARATVYRARRKLDACRRWMRRVEQRRGKNIAAVAIANKNARIAWALLTSEADYRNAASAEPAWRGKTSYRPVCVTLPDRCQGENRVTAIWVSPASSAPVLRHGRFVAWVLLRRARTESLRAGQSPYFPRTPHRYP